MNIPADRKMEVQKPPFSLFIVSLVLASLQYSGVFSTYNERPENSDITRGGGGGMNAETRRRWPNIPVTCWGLGYVCIDPRGKLDKTSASPPSFIPPVSWRRTIHLTSSYTALWRHRISLLCILQARGQSNFNFLHSPSAKRLVPRWTRMGDLQWTYSRFIDPQTLFESYPPANHVSCLWHCQTERYTFCSHASDRINRLLQIAVTCSTCSPLSVRRLVTVYYVSLMSGVAIFWDSDKHSKENEIWKGVVNLYILSKWVPGFLHTSLTLMHIYYYRDTTCTLIKCGALKHNTTCNTFT